MVILMETLIKPELELKRKVCENCGEGTFEFGEEPVILRYVCKYCSDLT